MISPHFPAYQQRICTGGRIIDLEFAGIRTLKKAVVSEFYLDI